MAIANGFETLMINTSTKNKFKEMKAKMEKDLGVKFTHSQALDVVFDAVLSDSIRLKFNITPMEGDN
jgi:hypothetical protein